MFEVSEDPLADIGVFADKEAVAGRVAGREGFPSSQAVLGETGCCPLCAYGIEGHPEVGAEVDGVVCDVQRPFWARGRAEYPEVDAPLLEVFGCRNAVVGHYAFAIGTGDRRARHGCVGQAVIVNDFQAREEIELSEAAVGLSGRRRE